MKRIIREMIAKAEYYSSISLMDEARDLLCFVRDLVNEMCRTYNCPSNWREIGEELAREYNEDSWVYEELELWNFMREY